jgi:hypothetical protein
MYTFKIFPLIEVIIIRGQHIEVEGKLLLLKALLFIV